MDYYTRKRNERIAAERRAARIETIKVWATAIAAVPVLWVLAILFLCI